MPFFSSQNSKTPSPLCLFDDTDVSEKKERKKNNKGFTLLSHKPILLTFLAVLANYTPGTLDSWFSVGVKIIIGRFQELFSATLTLFFPFPPKSVHFCSKAHTL